MSEGGERKAVFQFGYRKSPDEEAAHPVHHKVIVIGAGPVGLATAIDLAQRGVPVVLVDDADRIGEGSRGLCYSKRALEILNKIDVAKPVIDKGVTWKIGKVFFRDDMVYTFDLLPEDGHEMPAFVNLQQYYLEKYLVERADKQDGLEIRWSNRVTNVVNEPGRAIVSLETPSGAYDMTADYVIAADGARSSVRDYLEQTFDGQIFRDRFLIADIKMHADYPTERWFWFEPPFHGGQSTLLHRQADDVWRIDFQIGWDADPVEETREENVRKRLDKMLEGRTYDLEWISIYTFQCCRMDNFLHGRIIFAGDAAHQVSPFGARGANSGFEDAENIAWKLAAIYNGEAGPELLASYNLERGQGADWNIGHSTRSTDFITPKSEASMDFRNAILSLSQRTGFARQMVNSGRLSNPAIYATPLSTPDRERFNASAQLGYPAIDAPVSVNGESGYLLNHLGNGFSLLYADQGDTPDVPEGVKLCRVGSDIIDSESKILQRYDLKPGTAYLIRPDHHVAARWRSYDKVACEQALSRALGHVDHIQEAMA